MDYKVAQKTETDLIVNCAWRSLWILHRAQGLREELKRNTRGINL
jgi:hypothetical protein